MYMKTKHDITKSILKRIRLVEQGEREEITFKKDEEVLKKPEEQFRKFLIDGAMVQVSGIDATELEFADNEKEAFKTSMEGFINNVTDLVEFKILNISSGNIEWVGELTQENIEWVYSLDDQSGCYISANMLQLTDETVELITKLKQNYKEWVSTWGGILSDRRIERRKKTGKKEERRI
jgi:hypothetical protein